jgi:hypothetical protein
MGHPQLQGLAPGKDPVGRTTLRPPMDAGDGQVPVNLVQKRRCQLKSRGYRFVWKFKVDTGATHFVERVHISHRHDP